MIKGNKIYRNLHIFRANSLFYLPPDLTKISTSCKRSESMSVVFISEQKADFPYRA
jgi:hypothetical protein